MLGLVKNETTRQMDAGFMSRSEQINTTAGFVRVGRAALDDSVYVKSMVRVEVSSAS